MARMSLPSSIHWLVALLVCSGVALAAPARGVTRNLLQNPGFEEGLRNHPWMPASWDTSRAGLSSVFFGRDTLSPHGGSYSVSVANASQIYPLAHNWSQALLVGRELWGKDLVFSVWTRSIGVEGRAYIKLEAYRDTISKMSRIWNVDRETAAKRLGIATVDDPIIDLGWKRVFFSDPETGWVRREARVFVAPSVNMAYVRCGLIGTGQLMLDDASLTLQPALPAPEPPLRTNLLVDPGFEGDGNAWEYSLPPYPDMKAERETVYVHSGKASLGMSSAPSAMVQGKAGVSQVVSNRNLAGKRVRFTGFIKTDSLMSDALLKLYCHTQHGVVQDASTSSFSGTADWGQASVEMDVPPDTYELWVWFTYTAPARGRVYFDDASLEVLGRAAKR